MTNFSLNTVLLLEDESIIAIEMEDMLRDEGAANVVCLDTSAAALDWWRQTDLTWRSSIPG